jgi:hypothetical protein
LRIEMQEPNREHPTTENELLKRWKDRIDRELPRCMKSSTAMLLPKREMLHTEVADPSRAKDRQLKVDPKPT